MEAPQLTREYPRRLKVSGGSAFCVHRLQASDKERVLEFARNLDDDDRLFLRVDLTREDVIDEIIADQHDDTRVTLIAELDDEIVAYGALNRRNLDWMRWRSIHGKLLKTVELARGIEPPTCGLQIRMSPYLS